MSSKLLSSLLTSCPLRVLIKNRLFSDNLHLQKLPDEVLLNIMQFCNVKGLLALTECCTQFYNLTESDTKLMRKIRLVIPFQSMDLETLPDQFCRRYKNLQINMLNCWCSQQEISLFVHKLCRELGSSVEDFIVKTDSLFMKYKPVFSWMNAFLAQQNNLKHLKLNYRSRKRFVSNQVDIIDASWASMKFQLESFEYRGIGIDNPSNVAEFFSNQQQLKRLRIVFHFRYFYSDLKLQQHKQLLMSICNLTQLKDLAITIKNSPLNQEAVFHGLSNFTVKNLVLEEIEGFAECNPINVLNFMKVFQGASSVSLKVSSLLIDEISADLVEKIEVKAIWNGVFKCEPSKVPHNQKLFESNLLKLLHKCRKIELKELTIGSSIFWLNYEFQLSLEFCKNLVLEFQNIRNLKLYNVEEPERFGLFLKRLDGLLHGSWETIEIKTLDINITHNF